jgi:hypothetical protein
MTPDAAAARINEILNRDRCQHIETRFALSAMQMVDDRCWMTAAAGSCYCHQHQPATKE